MRKIYLLLSILFSVIFATAQVNITSTGTPLTQDFNTLALTGTANTWSDNTTIVGWYANLTTYRADAGGGNAGAMYSYGPASDPDRALGALTSGGVPTVQFGIRLKNTTGSSIPSFSVSYTGEQWRQTTNAQKLVFEYSTDATSITTGTWTPVTSLDFTAPKTGTAGALDGNAAGNRTSISGTVANTVADNAEIWFRWTKTASTSPGLAVDDFSVTASGTVVNSVVTGAVSTSPFCIDAATPGTGTVAFTSSGTYNTTFTAYLSDATGAFSSPVNIGSTTVNASNPFGTIAITIPVTTASGTGYRIRIDATSPAVTGSTSTAFEIVNGTKNATSVSAIPGNLQANISWTNPTSCFDEVLIVAKASASITATPTGDGSAYTASNAFGSGTAFDGGFVVYKGTTSPQTITGLTNGTTYYVRVFSRRGTNWSAGVEVTVTPNTQPGPGDIIINQLSPDYSGASNEYVELVNKTNNSYDLSGLALRYQSAGGTSGSAGGNLSGTLMGKKFWLLSPDATITVGQNNGIARDGAITAGFAGAAGQIALVRISDNVVIDAVGYGTITTPNYTETAAAPAPPTDGGIKRTPDGADTDNNSTDFVTVDNASIYLRNSLGESLPVRFSALKASQKGSTIQIDWSNATEENVVDYTIERSTNGRSFTTLGKIAARNSGGKADYNFVDATPFSGDNFYRVKAIETTGKTVYTNIVRINTTKKGVDLVVYPNPVKGSALNLQFSNLPAGNYVVKVYAVNGQEVGAQNLTHAGGSISETLSLKNLKHGLYTLQVTGAVSLQKTFLAE